MCIKLAPILLFAYKRLDTLRQTVGALQQNYHASESELFIFSDGAKTSEEEHTINDIRTYIRTINGFKSINVFEAGSNKGLANSIIDGVNMIMQDHKKVIVLEDDLVTSPNFLAYMNQSLEF